MHSLLLVHKQIVFELYTAYLTHLYILYTLYYATDFKNKHITCAQTPLGNQKLTKSLAITNYWLRVECVETSHSTLYRSFQGWFSQAGWPNQQSQSTNKKRAKCSENSDGRKSWRKTIKKACEVRLANGTRCQKHMVRRICGHIFWEISATDVKNGDIKMMNLQRSPRSDKCEDDWVEQDWIFNSHTDVYKQATSYLQNLVLSN